ncbi:hypothetical protein TNCV_1723771 [Trichonephila clavipes]|nr:hypothetical protein TNCV_1723771 [Trichonephila clavipes]
MIEPDYSPSCHTRSTLATCGSCLVIKEKIILTQEKKIQLMNKSDSEVNDLSEDDYAANKTYEPRKLERESSSDESNEKKNMETLAASPSTTNSILTNDEDDSVVIPLAKKAK